MKCCICERDREKVKLASDFDEKGRYCTLVICDECEADFDSLDITFNFIESNSDII